MPPRKPKLPTTVSHTVHAPPLILVTTLHSTGKVEYWAFDKRLPESDRVTYRIKPATYDRLVAAASAEAMDNIAFFIHTAIGGDPDETLTADTGEVVFETNN